MMSLFETDKTALIFWIMDEYGSEYRPTRRGWQKIRCIDADAHVHGDRNPSASVNIETGYYKCFSCGLTGDGYELLRKLKGWDVKQVNDAFGGEPVNDDEGSVWL